MKTTLLHLLRPSPRAALALACAALTAGAVPAGGQEASGAAAPPSRIDEVEVVEKLNEALPRDVLLRDTEGREVRLGEALEGDVPVLLTLVYFRCESLCSPLLGGITKAARNSGLSLGKDYRAVTVSIDPTDTPGTARERQTRQLDLVGAPGQRQDWEFLVGEDAEVRRVADAVGFKYRYDAPSKQYQHGAAVMVLTPEGRVSRYLYGIEFPPRDVKFALMEAAGGRVGTSFDRVVLRCFKYDPNTRRYELYIFGFIRGGALLVFGALAAALAVYWRREYKRGTIR